MNISILLNKTNMVKNQALSIAAPLTIFLVLVSLGGVGYYQFIWFPANNVEVVVPEEWLNPEGQVIIDILEGSIDIGQEDNFVPTELTAILGIDNRVVWTNSDTAMHTVTADSNSEETFLESAGRSNFVDAGEEYAFTFTMPGVYTYRCEPHPWMIGQVTILEPEGSTESEESVSE